MADEFKHERLFVILIVDGHRNTSTCLSPPLPRKSISRLDTTDIPSRRSLTVVRPQSSLCVNKAL